MEWINKVNDIINKVDITNTMVGNKIYNELDIVLSLIQTNSDLIDLDVRVKNYISLLSNTLEKIALLIKELALVKESFDIRKSIFVNDKIYYYNFRIDSYLSEDDIRKLDESYRRCLEIFKKFVRKIIYLIVTGKAHTLPKEEEEKEKQQSQYGIPLLPLQFPKEEKEENK